MNNPFMKKLPKGTEAANIMVGGELEDLDQSVMAFIRLTDGVRLGDMTEVPIPTRFLFILLGPSVSLNPPKIFLSTLKENNLRIQYSQGKNKENIERYHEIGRAMATILADEVFHDVAYKALERKHLLAGIDEFLDSVTVLPPGEWDPSIRIEPPSVVVSRDNRLQKNQPGLLVAL